MPKPVRVTPEVIDLVNRLSRTERAELGRQEKRIEKALPAVQEIGDALNVIRELKLYRETHTTFDAYLDDRWGFTRQRASQLISAAETIAALPAAVADKIDTERKARAIKPVADRPTEAKQAIDTAAGDDGVPSAADIQRAVAKIVGTGNPDGGPGPDLALTPQQVAAEWVRTTDNLPVESMPVPVLRKIRATAAGLVTAVDKHFAGPSTSSRNVEPRFKKGS